MSFDQNDHGSLTDPAMLTKAALAILAGLTIAIAVSFLVEPAGSWQFLLGMMVRETLPC
jgi:hypothetical protein